MIKQNQNRISLSLTGKTYLLIILAAIAILLTSTLAYGANEDEPTEKKQWKFNPHKLIKPLGICTITCLLTTFSIGLFRKKLGRKFLILHKTFAFITVIIALTHGILVLTLF